MASEARSAPYSHTDRVLSAAWRRATATDTPTTTAVMDGSTLRAGALMGVVEDPSAGMAFIRLNATVAIAAPYKAKGPIPHAYHPYALLSVIMTHPDAKGVVATCDTCKMKLPPTEERSCNYQIGAIRIIGSHAYGVAVCAQPPCTIAAVKRMGIIFDGTPESVDVSRSRALNAAPVVAEPPISLS